LPGVQIHHIDPINKGEVVWTINPRHLVFIGRLFNQGKLDLRHRIAVAGSEVKKPAYYECIAGCSIDSLTSDNLLSTHVRIISGNVLSGTHVQTEGYLGYYHNHLSIIPEGDEYEFLGWLIPSYPRPTISNSFPISKFLTKTFKVNTNLHGEERAYVVTGQYDQVLPMDILPVHLIKAILAKDLDKMERLGIYEVIEEDLALCEFVCTSKIEVQEILSEGLELMAEEG
jgi:Na+-transporting NADH:ubiquinone oxidoreductase subunit A